MLPWIAALLLLLVPNSVLLASNVDVFSQLDKGEYEPLKEMKPTKLFKKIAKGRKLPKAKAGKEVRRIKDHFGRETDLHLIIPKKPKGVLFILHGLGANGEQLLGMFRRYAAKEGLIIAGPTAQKEPNDHRNEDYVGQISGYPIQHWWCYRDGNFVFSALKALKREFPIDEDRVFISGYSMGGFGTWNMGLRYPDRFAAMIPCAGGISRHEYQLQKHDKMRSLLFNAYHIPAMFLHGDADQIVPARFDRDTSKALKDYDYDHKYVEVRNGRHELDVSEGTPLNASIQKWLKPRVRNAHPKEVRFYSLGAHMNQCYWLRIDEFDGESAEVTAKIKKGNKYSIQAKGVKKLTIFLDEELVKLKKKVTIVLNGKEVFSGTVKPSVDAIIESWKAREDRKLLYKSMVTVEVGDE